MFTRRRFLTNSSLAAAAVTTFPHVGRSATQLQARSGQKPRHIIHLVSDGMSAGTFTCADHLSRLVRSRGTTWINLCHEPGVHSGWMNMRSLNSLVTDSSAAASSWGSGVRIINGMTNQSGNGTPLKTLYELFADIGWVRALVTTTEITHATPSGFVASVRSRDYGSKIAAQYLERQVDLLLGGGRKFFEPAYRLDKRNLRQEFVSAGYYVMDTLADLEKAPMHGRWLGTFASSHLPFTLDQKHDPKLQATVPTLARMTQAALSRLEKEPHFIMQVEGGRVDHGCHNCDAAAALYDQLAFDEALEVCLDFQKRVSDTLLVITTDHGNSNLGLNGMGTDYGQSTWLFYNLEKVRRSFPEMLKPLRRKLLHPPFEPEKDEIAEKKKEDKKTKEQKEADKAKTKKEDADVAEVPEIIEIIEAGTGYKLATKKAELLRPYLAKTSSDLYDLMNNDVCALGQVMANFLGIGFVGNAHTADFVPVTAVGPGAERFRGFIQNVDVFKHYTELAGIDFQNPQEPLISGVGPDAGQVEDAESYQLA